MTKLPREYVTIHYVLRRSLSPKEVKSNQEEGSLYDLKRERAVKRGRVRVRENELNPHGGGRKEGLKKK